MNELRDRLIRVYLVDGTNKLGILKEIGQISREIQLKTVEGVIFIPNASILYAVEEKPQRSRSLSEERKREYARLEGND